MRKWRQNTGSEGARKTGQNIGKNEARMMGGMNNAREKFTFLS